MKKGQNKPITVTVINPEALPAASEKITRFLYEKYLEEQRKKVISIKSE